MAKATSKKSANGSLRRVSLHELHLDDSNPRFGGRLQGKREEFEILEEIVSQHGITDVISSISVNGFFDSEPLVGAINKSHGDEITVLEGNRRLTACLICAGDERAKLHASLHEKYKSEHLTANTKIPVQVYDWADKEQQRRLLPYLGIRHIVGAAEWDSYAKAAWVARTLEESELSIENIRAMIGDDQKFVDRIVEGYYLVSQIIETNAYDPKDSLRRGRGSMQEFPFSWIYTALGYRNIRDYLQLPRACQIAENPLDDTALESAGKLFGFMFGRSGTNAAIDDSRQIGKLAQALGNEESLSELEQGRPVEHALEVLRPPEKRFLENLKRADSTVEKCVGIASGFRSLDQITTAEFIEACDSLAIRLEKLIEILESTKKSSRRVRRSSRSDEAE